MASLSDIENLTKQYASARDLLSERVNALNEEIELLKKQKLPGIKNTLNKVAEAHAKLESAIEESSYLFTKPKTFIFHGIQIGFRKGKGKMDWGEDDERIVKLIRKYFPDKADTLIRTKETPIKKALEELPVPELKKLGITVEDTGDVVVVKAVAGEVEKIVDALLKGAKEEAA